MPWNSPEMLWLWAGLSLRIYIYNLDIIYHIIDYRYICIHTYMHAYIHTCIHAYIHTYMHTYIHRSNTYIHSSIHTSMWFHVIPKTQETMAASACLGQVSSGCRTPTSRRSRSRCSSCGRVPWRTMATWGFLGRLVQHYLTAKICEAWEFKQDINVNIGLITPPYKVRWTL